MVRQIITQMDRLIMPSEPTSNAECLRLDLWEDLKDTLRASKSGVALSAIQIGIPLQAFIVAKDIDRRCINLFVNPVIRDSKQPFVFKNEGCLSYPNIYISTNRFNEVTMTDDINGRQKYTGLMAVIVLHEYGHTIGETMFDYEHKENK